MNLHRSLEKNMNLHCSV